MDLEFIKKLNEIKVDELDKLDEKSLLEMADKIAAIKREFNPYSAKNIVPSDEFLLMLFTPIHRHYLIKLIFTSIIGFLNRACDEWRVPDDVPVVSVYDYIEDPSLLDIPKPAGPHGELDPELKQHYIDSKKFMEKRIIVREFLEYLFQYDPDEHVRSSYTPNKRDPNRRPITTPAAKLSVWMEKRRQENAKRKNAAAIKKAQENVDYIDSLSAPEEKTYVKEITQRIGSRKGGYKIVKRKIKCTKKEYNKYMESDKTALMPGEVKILPKLNAPKNKSFEQYASKLREITHTAVRDMIPPNDLMYRFNYYLDANYEELIESTYDLYGIRPDIDYAIQPLGMVPNLDAAREFRRKLDDKVKNWSIYTAQKGAWTLLGPYNKNREKLDFHGSNMPLIEEMFLKMESDQQIGAEMMRRRKNKKVREQTKKVGEVPADIKTHAAAVTNVSQYISEVNKPDVDYTSEDEAVIVKVNRISAGGRKIEEDTFETDYDVETTVQQLNADPSKTE